MKMIEHYLKLSTEFSSEAVAISIQEVAGILCCTPRNAKLILSKLENLQWIRWKRGGGRGHKSEVQFLKQPCTLLFETVKKKHGGRKDWSSKTVFRGI
ncbi:hypothetical protein HOO54_07800 [Bacillus sp. WMMC1349]|uniref:SgrR family transcriptional regulator n=1 Tax=Bacillus sp. WMMC1349 TaxID=2736254 RepID=UPI0015530BBA|nr:SgrR family transcriptional regulator [Bacillus sp. WMMC1349]NPC92121.1 hypothetical protein [Bacillus sp. WMMC1349]